MKRTTVLLFALVLALSLTALAGQLAAQTTTTQAQQPKVEHKEEAHKALHKGKIELKATQEHKAELKVSPLHKAEIKLEHKGTAESKLESKGAREYKEHAIKGGKNKSASGLKTEKTKP